MATKEAPRALLEKAYDRIEELEAELESLRKRDDDAKRTLQSHLDALRADSQMVHSRAERVISIVRKIVNDPQSERVTVQGNLLIALEIYDGRRP